MPSLVKLLSKSRTRRIPKGVQKLLEKRAEVSDEEALRAAERLQSVREGRATRYGLGAALGAGTYPTIATVGDVVGGVVKGVHRPGGLARSAAIAKNVGGAFLKNVDPAELSKQVVKGGLTGSAVQALRETVSALPDAQKVEQYIKRHRGE